MYSQAGQDDWILSHIPKGTYLEIGASHPVNINNTMALEQRGWTGISIDIDNQCEQLWKNQRSQPLVIDNALTMDFVLPERIDYLQIDIDPAEQSLACLKRMLATGCRFNLITFEHDYYTGVDVRTESRELLTAAGYHLEVADVSTNNQVFEDWWMANEFKTKA